MKTSLKLTAAALVVGLLSGCAGTNQATTNRNLICAAIGGLAGGAVTSAATDGGGLEGAAVGAALALLVCPSDEQPQPAEPAPEPKKACAISPAPAGALLDANGCAYDTDKDGVVDGVDLCRNTPEGVTVDDMGCPLDSDHDAVADYEDACPNTPSGTLVDQKGCPEPGQKILSLTGVNFGFDKATLTADSKQILNKAVDALKDNDAVVEVRVEGHTDSIGSEAYNLKLSQKRAEAVVAYLVSQGIDGSKLVPVGMGEKFPVANNATAAGRAANRRVDFVVGK